ncbi:hypothetical protein ACQ4PT_046180 [Festuca glaucescens]
MSDNRSSRSGGVGILAADSGGGREALREGEIGDLFDQLELGDEDFDDFVIDDEDAEIAENTRWLAVARVVCPKKISHEALFQQMQTAWNPMNQITMRPVAENMFVIQCFCLGDWEKVMERGPWLFRDWALVLAPYDGFSDPANVELNFMPVWLQIHKIPEAFRKEKTVKPMVARQAGEVVTVEMTLVGAFRGDFVRVRVKHDVRMPLTRFVSISHGGKRHPFVVKYEKLGSFCHACGKIGHEHKECGQGIFEEKELKFGDWIYANPPNRNRGSAVLRGNWRGGRSDTGGARGRGGVMVMNPGSRAEGIGRGRGGYVDWRNHPEHNLVNNGKNMNEELDDTAISPVKVGDVHMTDNEKNAKKRLSFDQEGMQASDAHDNQDVDPNKNALMIIDGSKGLETEVENDDTGKENKRHKKDGDTSSANTGSAASLEGDRQTQ